MRKLLAVLLLSAAALPAGAAPPAGFEQTIAKAMAAFDVPGMSVAIIEDGKVVFAKGFGVRSLADPKPVDATTLFGIGSCTKAFTAATVATLVDDGKLAWDDRVGDRLPGFRLKDPVASSQITVRELLTHRAGFGMGAGDLMFVPATTYSRAEIVHRLRDVPAAYPFRTRLGYSNVLYVAAGEVVRQASGEASWETYLKRRIFDPVGMNATVVGTAALNASPNHVVQHARTDLPLRLSGKPEVIDADLFDAIAPAGSIASNVEDLSRWVQVQLAEGALPDGKRVWSAARTTDMRTYETPLPIQPLPASMKGTEPNFAGAGLGWMLRDFAGRKIVQHDGGILGSTAKVVMVPEAKLGFIVLSNIGEVWANNALMWTVLQHYLQPGTPSRDWIAAIEGWRNERAAGATGVLEKQAAEDKALGSAPMPLPAAKYAGTYRDPWYGTMTISDNGGKLFVRMDPAGKAMQGELQHVRLETFRAHWENRALEDAYVTFQRKADGSIDRLRVEAASPLADFSYDYQDLDLRPIPVAAAK